MRPDIRKKYLKHIYKGVENLYCNKFMTIGAASRKMGVSPSVYYAACYELGKKSVNYDKTKDTQEGGEKKTKIKKDTKKKKAISHKNAKEDDVNSDSSRQGKTKLQVY